MKISFSILIFCLFFIADSVKAGGPLAKTPPMGWNSWNWGGKNAIDEDLIKEVIDAVAKHKLLQESGGDIVLIASVYRFCDWCPEHTHMGRPTSDTKSRQSVGQMMLKILLVCI